MTSREIMAEFDLAIEILNKTDGEMVTIPKGRIRALINAAWEEECDHLNWCIDNYNNEQHMRGPSKIVQINMAALAIARDIFNGYNA